MSESYVRSSDDAMMIEVAPHQYVNRKVFHPRARLNDRHPPDEAAAERRRLPSGSVASSAGDAAMTARRGAARIEIGD